MKKLIIYLILTALCGLVPLKGQDVEYKLNPRTGKFDMVRSTEWLKANSGNSFNAKRTVTRSGLPAINTGDSTVTGFLNNYFFPSTSPTATISPSIETSREYMGSSALPTLTVNWTVTRPVACLSIASIKIDKINFAPNTVGSVWPAVQNISEGGTQSGTLNNQPYQKNAITSYSITVTSSDGKTGSASFSINWYWKRYWGAFASTVPPTDASFTISDAQILALTGAGVGSGNELASDKAKTYNGIAGGGNYLVFAFPSSWGTPTFVVNGLINTAFTRVRNYTFVNASGGSTTYQVWVSNAAQNGAIAQFQIQ